MSDGTKISWSSATWNPTTGCDQVSPGCDHCYALTLAARLKRMGNVRYQNDGSPKTSGPGFALTLHPDKIHEPLKWKKPRHVFVNSMSDLFHDDVPDVFIADVFVAMACAHWHTFQVLTKRPRRMAHLMNSPDFLDSVQRGLDMTILPYSQAETVGKVAWPLPNVWLGTSVEDQKRADLRIPLLLETPAAVRFLSCEPLLGPVEVFEKDHRGHENEWDGAAGYICLDCTSEDGPDVRYYEVDQPAIHWVIAGGESGPDYREMNPDWARSLRDQCVEAEVPFFYKQGSGPRSEMHKELDGREWAEMPERVGV